MGKTLALKLLPARLGAGWRLAHLPHPALEPEGLWRWAANELGLAEPSEAALRRCADDEARRGRAIVLAVDDANRLPPESRLALEIACTEQQGLHCVLADGDANPSPDAIPLATPLTLPELRAYVDARLDLADADADARARFDEATLEQLHRETAGVPGRVHLWITRSLLRDESGRRERAGSERPEEPAAPLVPADPAVATPTVESPAPPAPARPPLAEVKPGSVATAEASAPAPPDDPGGPAAASAPAEIDDRAPVARDEEAAQAPLPPPRASAADRARIAAIARQLDEQFGARTPAAPPETEAEDAAPDDTAQDPAQPAMAPGLATAPRTPGRGNRRVPLSLAASFAVGLVALGLGFALHSPDDGATPTATPATAAGPAQPAAAAPAESAAPATSATLPDVAARGPGIPPQAARPALSAEPPPTSQPSAAAPAPAADDVAAPLPVPVVAAAAPQGDVALGRINVNALPWARIRVDGELVGETPLGEHRMPHGTHVIEATFPDGRVERREIELGADEIFVVFR
jgi:hypothetical protein